MFASPNRPLVNFAHSGFCEGLELGRWGKAYSLSLSHVCAGVVPKRRPAEWIMPRGKSPDFRSLTLRIKLSMNAVYQLMPSRKWPPRTASEVGRRLLTHAPVSPTHLWRCEDEAFSETFLDPIANGFISSDGFSHEAPLTRQCGAQTAAQSICSGTPSGKT
jgi:hypothetical protein